MWRKIVLTTTQGDIMEIVGILVKGDTDNTYTVTASGSGASCTCKAFLFGQGEACKHMRFALEKIAEFVA